MTSPQGGVNLGSAYGSISITDNIDAAIGKATQSFDNALTAIGGRMEQLGNRMSDIGGKLTLVSAPLALFGGQGVKAAASFEDALAEIRARASLTADELDVVRETALRMGAETSFSTQQAADAFLNLLTAGLSTEEALATLPAVLTGAAAAGADLGTTANQVTNIMSSFQIEAGEAARIVEVMNQAAGASPAEMAEMGDALAMVGGDARNFGLSLEQTGAILTVFARNGKTGTEAATQLRSILTTMTSGTTDNVRAWEMVGSSLFDASGNARDFGVVLEEIDAGLQNLSAEDQAFVIQNLAGSYGRVGLNALLASDGIEAVIGEMNEQASASDVAEARLDTLNGRFESMMGSIEALQITAFTPFNEWLKTLVERATEFINVLTAWVDKNQEIVQPILKVVAVLLLIGPALLALGPIVSLIGSSLGVLGTVFAFLTNPMLLVAKLSGIVGAAISFLLSPIGLAIAAVVALGLAWQTNFMGIRDRVMPILEGIKHVLSIFVDDVKTLGLGEAIAGIFGEGSIADTMESSLEGALTMMGVSRDRAIEIVSQIWNVIRPAIDVVSDLFTAFQTSFNNFRTNLQSGLGVFKSLDFAIQTFFGSLGVGGPVIGRVRSAIIGIISVLRDGLGAAVQFAQFLFAGLISFFQTVVFPVAQHGFGAAFGVIVTLFQAIGDAWTNQLQPAFARFGEAMGELSGPSGGGSMLVSVLTFIIDGFAWLANGIIQLVVPVLAALVVWFLDHLPMAIQFLVDIWNNFLMPVFRAVGNFIMTTVMPALQQLGQWFLVGWDMAVKGAKAVYDNVLVPIWNGISDFINNVVMPALNLFWDWFTTSGFPAIKTAVTDFITNYWNMLRDGFTVFWDLISPVLNSLWDWFTVTAFPAVKSAITDFITNYWNMLRDGFTLFWDLISPVLDSVWNWFTTGGFQEIKNAVMDFMTNAWDVLKNAVIGIWDAISPSIQALKDGLFAAFDWIKVNVIDPIIGRIGDAINNFNDLKNAFSTDGIGGFFSELGSQGSELVSGAANTVSGWFGGSQDSGGRGQAGMAYLIGRGAQPEMYIPDSPGTFIPNADELFGGSGINLNGPVYINANTYEGGQAAARGLKEEIEELNRIS